MLRAGPIDTVVCHVDFDGLASAAKWIRGGTEPYPGADDDARAVDTRLGDPGPTGKLVDFADCLVDVLLGGGVAAANRRHTFDRAAGVFEQPPNALVVQLVTIAAGELCR